MSTDTKFTPGPWRFAYDECGKSSEIIGSKRVNLIEPIAKIPHDDMTEEGEVEMFANAHLIAAAPDLYEVVRRYVASMQGGEHLLFAAESALAKARGEA